MADLLTTTEVADLDLFDELVSHLNAEREELRGQILAESKDSKRRFRGAVRTVIFERDGGQCFYCGAQIDGRWHADHVIPHSLGGQTVSENGVVSCPGCNLKKGARVW